LKQEQDACEIIYHAKEIQVHKDGRITLGKFADVPISVKLGKSFVDKIISKSLWWNSQKHQVSSNFIKREVYQFEKIQSESIYLIDIEDKFVLLVDSPGMGKSNEMANLEIELRIKHPKDRIIIHVKLHETQNSLTKFDVHTVEDALMQLAPLVPFEELDCSNLKIFLLLDELDEVAPKHQEAMIKILWRSFIRRS